MIFLPNLFFSCIHFHFKGMSGLEELRTAELHASDLIRQAREG